MVSILSCIVEIFGDYTKDEKFVKEMVFILVCKLGEKEINCYDGTHDRDTLKAWSKKGILRCPQCGEQYTYNHGKVRIQYFKHLNSDCVMYGEPETEEHIQGKIDLFEWIQKQDGVSDVRLEGWLPETKQRPDIMFKYNGEQYVVEYQCSPISSEYIERHELYQAAGIHDIWICGAENYMQWYHDGDGNKRENYLESICQRYYDPKIKMFFFYNSLIPEGSRIQKRYISFNQIEDIPYVYHDICVEQVKQNLFAYDINDVWFLNGDFAISYDSWECYESQYICLRHDVNEFYSVLKDRLSLECRNAINVSRKGDTFSLVDIFEFDIEKNINISFSYINGKFKHGKKEYDFESLDVLMDKISDKAKFYVKDINDNLEYYKWRKNIKNTISKILNGYNENLAFTKKYKINYEKKGIYQITFFPKSYNEFEINVDENHNKIEVNYKRWWNGRYEPVAYAIPIDLDIKNTIQKILTWWFLYESDTREVLRHLKSLSNKKWTIDYKIKDFSNIFVSIRSKEINKAICKIQFSIFDLNDLSADVLEDRIKTHLAKHMRLYINSYRQKYIYKR